MPSLTIIKFIYLDEILYKRKGDKIIIINSIINNIQEMGAECCASDGYKVKKNKLDDGLPIADSSTKYSHLNE